MKFNGLLQKRRYRRLSLALIAALLVHLGLMLSGQWGILRFSAPSTEDRVLTLTLENTVYEGLRETSETDTETVNDVKVGEAKATKAAVSEAKPSISKPEVIPPKPEVEPTVVESLAVKAEFTEPEPLVEEVVVDQAVPDQPVIDTPQWTAPLLEPLEPIQTSASRLASNLLNQALLTAENAVFKINAEPLTPKPEDNEAPPIESITKPMDTTQQRKMTKKVQKWSNKFERMSAPPDALNWQQDGQEYTATFTEKAADSDMQMDEMLVEVATEQDGKKLTTRLRYKKLAFSNFAQFVHHWDPNISVHEDTLDGRFHSNTRINLASDQRNAPVFLGKVTTASYNVNFEGPASRKKIFKGGLETGVKKIRMPKPKQLFAEGSYDPQRTVFLNQDARLIFTADGHYLWQAINGVGPMQKFAIGDTPLYLMAAPNVSLRVSGVVNGAVAVYSPKRIVIENDITYASTADLDKGGDFLGLISGRSVVIGRRNTVKPGDLTIHASIYASNRFAVPDLLGKRVGTIKVFGSVTASTITATEPRYATDIVFDQRLKNLRPPGFPVTDRYELVAQENQWRVEQDPYYESPEPPQATSDFASSLEVPKITPQ